ncbi:cytochrome d ubiquinol oxidase subunit II [Brachybacterium endophyticum]|uniref:Cytochrome d ubiquinol oxidase subunit II n=1 Tax=Brachybacterium endophyticum TaxID=2182385 RepID=A0A2U2RHZ6_9MICO|nr:cytochrome d ubiquinol oxidase subunit II [Brachybacterium endophyticum]PWH05502.1 cytochrome d ubiquinol oxidase subunit II [Brachybacterium endophyticum]
MDLLLQPTALQTLWFCLIALMFTAYFVLEGFDFGVGMNVAALGRGRGAAASERRGTILKTVGPVWDGNEVWLIAGGACLFAAFPEWYATLFSGFYLPLLLILLSLILRVCAFKWREKEQGHRWRTAWDVVHVITALLPALLWGVAFANIVAGVSIDERSWVTTSMLGLLSPFGLLGGIVFVLLFWLHGTLYLALRTRDPLRSDARRLASILVVPTLIAAGVFLVWEQLTASHTALTWIPLVIAALGLLAVIPANLARRTGLAFTASAIAIAAAGVQLFGGLFPYVMPAANRAANSLTVANASSSGHTLGVMAISAAIFLPLVIAYQIWAYWVFRHRVEGTDSDQDGLFERARRGYRAAFEQE